MPAPPSPQKRAWRYGRVDATVPTARACLYVRVRVRVRVGARVGARVGVRVRVRVRVTGRGRGRDRVRVGFRLLALAYDTVRAARPVYPLG